MEAAVGASTVPDHADAREDVLGWRLDVLGRRNIDPERVCLGAAGGSEPLAALASREAPCLSCCGIF